jgi:hypothetical protein
MTYKVRRMRLGLGTPPQPYDLYSGEEWQEFEVADDEALLKVPWGIPEYHVDVREGSTWRCLSANSSCFVLDAKMRERARLAKVRKERLEQEARERAKAEAVALREQAEAAKKAAKDAEQRAAELETANT